MKRSIENGNKNKENNAIKHYKEIVEGSTFQPRGVNISDIDTSVMKHINEIFDITVNGKKLEVVNLFSIARFNEFIQKFDVLINNKTNQGEAIKLPFLTLVRGETKRGSNFGTNYNIPNDPKFTVYKRKILKNGITSYEYYNVPQPTHVDIEYGFHLFTEHQRIVNEVDEGVLYNFNKSQSYVNVNGHFMPLKLANINDSSEINNVEKRKFYHRSYNLIIKGYMLKDDDFEKQLAIETLKIKNVLTKPRTNVCEISEVDLDCDLCLNFKFNRRNEKSASVLIPMDLEFYYDNQNNNNYNYFLNNEIVQLPFNARKGDELTVAHSINIRGSLNIKICGRKL